MPFDSRQGGGAAAGSIACVTLDAFADSLASKPPAGDAATLFRWADHQKVFLLRFPDRGAQSAALGRLSIFLEDAAGRGTVSAVHLSGRTAGVAAYSGHNCRASDAAGFFNTARDSSVALLPAEEALRSLLLAHRLLLPAPGGRYTGAAGSCLLSVPRGLPRGEAADTLLHEAMHGLFYADEAFAKAVNAFWASQLSEAQRGCWRAFLGALGYDATNEELVVNEFQAYMATERVLFGGERGGGRGVGPGGEAAQAELRAMQGLFATKLAAAVPAPAPRVGGCLCLFASGPFKLK